MAAAAACPFVSFVDERDQRDSAPNQRHRCFADIRPSPRSDEHQRSYCLTSAFPACPTFQDWATRQGARPVPPPQPAAGSPLAALLASDPQRGKAPGPSEDELPSFLLSRSRRASEGGSVPTTHPLAAASPTVDRVPPRRRGTADEHAWTGGEAVGASRRLWPGDTTRMLPKNESEEPGALTSRGAPRELVEVAQARPAARRPSGSRPLPRQGRAGGTRREARPGLWRRSGLDRLPPPLLAAVAVAIIAVGLFLAPRLFLGDPDEAGAGAGASRTPASVAASPSRPAVPTPQTYVVAAGDTMAGIARKFSISVEELVAANPGIRDVNRIKVGDQVTIPGGGTRVSGSPSP